MKTSELMKKLEESMKQNGDLPVNVIFDGKIDRNPEICIVDDRIYIEGSR